MDQKSKKVKKIKNVDQKNVNTIKGSECVISGLNKKLAGLIDYISVFGCSTEASPMNFDDVQLESVYRLGPKIIELKFKEKFAKKKLASDLKNPSHIKEDEIIEIIERFQQIQKIVKTNIENEITFSFTDEKLTVIYHQIIDKFNLISINRAFCRIVNPIYNELKKVLVDFQNYTNNFLVFFMSL